MDDILILFCVAFLIGYIPAQGFKKGINEFSSELSFVVGRAMIGVDITFEAFNKIGYLFKSFFDRKSPWPSFFKGGLN